MTSRAPAAPVSIAGLRLAASSTNAGSPRLTTQPTEHVGLTYRSIATALRALLDRRGFVEKRIAARYQGHRWSDATERSLIDDIVKERW
jgi:hypothetical protein